MSHKLPFEFLIGFLFLEILGMFSETRETLQCQNMKRRQVTQNQNNNLWIHKVLSHVKFEPTTMGELGIDVATA